MMDKKETLAETRYMEGTGGERGRLAAAMNARRSTGAARGAWGVWIVAAAVFFNGLEEVVWVLSDRISDVAGVPSGLLPFGLLYLNRSLSLVFGLALIYLSLNLLRRKRVAWWLALAGSLAAATVPPASGWSVSSVLVPGATAALLLLFRDPFRVRSEPRSVTRGAGLAAFALLAALAYGTAGFWLLPVRDFDVDFSLVEALFRTLGEYARVGNDDLTPLTPRARWFLDSLDLASVVAGSYAAFSLFRPLKHRLRTLPRERRHAEGILRRHGSSSLDYFKLLPDKSYFFSGSGDTFVAYGVAAGAAVALGDPNGPEEELEETIRRFSRFCSDNGWAVAFHQTLPDLLPVYRSAGLRAIKIGEEAVIDLERLANSTAKRKSFRRIRRKLEREGCSFGRSVPPHPGKLLDEAEEVSREWLSLPGRRERAFTLGAFDRGYAGSTPLALVRDAQGRMVAFANEIPSYREGEATIDMMRHRLETPNGTMDYLLLELMLALAEEGYATFDLGLAPLSGVGERERPPLEERALKGLNGQLNRFFSYKGLRDYKAKFDPEWEDRFLVYGGGPAGLARVALAVTRLTEGRR